jgi:2-oxoisovalerate dehydrogenase E1 component alpha subunit
MGAIVHHDPGADVQTPNAGSGRCLGDRMAPEVAMVDGLLGSAVQLLTPEGERVPHETYDIALTDAELRSLYRDMVLVRRLDTEATALQRQGELGLWASSLGQEAAQVGSGRCLRPGDFAFPTYRDHGVTWSRGVQPLEILAMFRGVTNGGWDPKAHGCAIYTIVIGNQVLHGVGYAMGVQLDGTDDAVIAYFGDGATDEGDVNEGFVFGSVFNAPVVFFCQNNQWAISSPRDRHGRTPLYERAAGFGFPGVQVDGNDILAVMAVTRDALERARSGGGPTFIEAFTYRMAAHTTSDDPTRYRHAEDLEIWRLRDPIERLKVFLARQGIADRQYFDHVEREANDLAVLVRDGARSMRQPDATSMFDHVYVEPHAPLARQRLWLQDYESSFVDEGAS